MSTDKFPQRLKSRREELGMSQETLATAIDAHSTQISRYERGLVMPRISTLKTLARVLECSANYLLCAEVNNTFQERLAARREELFMTQTDLAKAIGVSAATISQYESGNRQPASEILVLLTEAIDCSADYLMGRIDTLQWDTSFIENDPVLKEMADGMLAMSETSKRSLADFTDHLHAS